MVSLTQETGVPLQRHPGEGFTPASDNTGDSWQSRPVRFPGSRWFPVPFLY